MAFPTSGSASGANLQIGIAIVLQDRFSNQAREAHASLKRLHNEAKAVANANLSAVRNFAGMGAAIGVGVLSKFGDIIQEGANYIDTMQFVDNVTTKNIVSMQELGNMAKSLGADTMFMARDVASGMQFMAMAGMDSKEIFESIGAAVNLAGATLMDLGGKGGAADLLTNVMRMYKFETKDAARVSDILTTAVTSSNTNVQDLAEAVKYAGTTVSNLGGSLEQTAAMVGVMGNAGIQASMAGTSVANAYRYLTYALEGTNKKGSKALASLGLAKEDFLDDQGRLIDMSHAVNRITEAMQGLGDTERFAKLVSIFGVRGERAASVLGRSADSYNKLLEKLQTQSAGRAASDMEKRMETLAGTLNQMVSALENIRISFAESLSPILSPAFKMLAQFFNMVRLVLQTPVVGTLISGFLTFIVTLATLRLAFIALKATIKLTFNDSTISFKNMVAFMSTGWKRVVIGAKEYQLTLAQIATQEQILKGLRASGKVPGQAAGAAGAMAVIMSTPGKAGAIGGVYYEGGKWYKQTGKEGTGAKRISQIAAARRLSAAQGATAGILGAGAGAAAVGARGILGGIGRALSVGVRLLGGPIGIGITALVFFLPAIINAIFGSKSSNDKNSSSTDRNTKAIDANSEAQKEILNKRGEQSTKDREEAMLYALQQVVKLLEQQNNAPGSRVNVILDGLVVGEGEVKKGQVNDIYTVGG